MRAAFFLRSKVKVLAGLLTTRQTRVRVDQLIDISYSISLTAHPLWFEVQGYDIPETCLPMSHLLVYLPRRRITASDISRTAGFRSRHVLSI